MIKMLLMPKTICSILTVVIIAAFVGFCVENIWIFFRYGFVDNRGMHLPFLLGYGLACIVMYLCFGLPDNPRIFGYIFSNTKYANIIYFCMLFVAIIIGESLLGYTVEFFTSIQWWDYSTIPLHIGRYTSIPTSLGFTCGAYLFFDKLFPHLYKAGEKLYDIDLSKLIVLLAALLVLDNISALKYMHRHHNTITIWKFERRMLERKML